MASRATRTLWGAAAVLAAAVVAAPRPAPVERTVVVRSPGVTPSPPCPAQGLVVPPGAALQPVLDRSEPGSVLCLSSGTYAGPVEIRRRLTLQGPSDATVRSSGSATTIRVEADSAVLRGFTVEGSGRRYDKMDGGVYLRGRAVEVRGLTVRDALFGIVVEQSEDATIADNRVYGLAQLPVGVRGDGIRLWEVRGSRVEDNHLEDSRDILVWYSPGNRIEHNTVVRSRYATHFMYSDDCVVEDGDYEDNIVGVFVMYSRGITLRGTRIAGNTSVDGLGLGVKESGNLLVESNRFLDDRDCLYLDTSPFRQADSVLVRRNTFAGCDAGVTFHSSERRNTFRDNAFLANRTHVAVEGRGNARAVSWSRNYFDDYQGYDLDDDGLGDVPYELRSLTERLVASRPGLAFFRGTVAFDLLEVAARVFPLLEPETLLTDPHPRMDTPGPA